MSMHLTNSCVYNHTFGTIYYICAPSTTIWIQPHLYKVGRPKKMRGNYKLFGS